ncbi:peroxiredoxin [Aureisphaera galaxeae]|uniref:peroxiredoxin n=1 Tax=Aureisphaera galaxeae TaxID=1538023 RepID=UPI002350749B|nr:peroxiredoxin [Aureisphaera galaxeae]MDC8004511.1 peroxiredoxin [Aureisphaera galaxeae]
MELGDKLPEFTLNDQEGNSVSSSDFEGNSVVIFFYPKNFTPGCVREACSFRDSFEDFSDLGATVFGISADSESSHKRFAKHYRLPFTLLADTKNKVRRQFGVKKGLLGILPGRETFIFNKEGKLVYKFAAMGADPHIKNALTYLQKEHS